MTEIMMAGMVHSLFFELTMSEKSYDILPNFTAVDCMCLSPNTLNTDPR